MYAVEEPFEPPEKIVTVFVTADHFTTKMGCELPGKRNPGPGRARPGFHYDDLQSVQIRICG
jgi:hypothetical protein